MAGTGWELTRVRLIVGEAFLGAGPDPGGHV